MAVTIHDVAKRAGVAVSTVSKYINHGNLQDDVRVRVEQAIKELEYVPNDIARGLKNKKSFAVGVVVPTMKSMFSASIISVMSAELEKKGYSVLFTDCNGEKKRELDKIRFLSQKMVDAFVILPSKLIKDDLIGLSKPVVLFDKFVEDYESDYVGIDNFNAAFEGTNRLIDNGHTDIAVLAGEEGIFTSNERINGYIAALKQAGIPFNKERVIHTDFTFKVAYEKMCDLIKSENLPTAIFTLNDDCTMGAITALNRFGVKIPEDISIIGFDSITMADISNPKIEIVYQPCEEMGIALADCVIRHMTSKGKKSKKIILKHKIYSGDSIKNLKQ